jgi:hypothetical protein
MWPEHLLAGTSLQFPFSSFLLWSVRGCNQKFPDRWPGARTANCTAFCTRCSCIAILWISLKSFAAISLCVASQRVFIIYCKCIFLYRLSLETFGYTLVFSIYIFFDSWHLSLPYYEENFTFQEQIYLAWMSAYSVKLLFTFCMHITQLTLVRQFHFTFYSTFA